MSQSKFRVSQPAQREYRVLGGERPSGAYAAARAAWDKAGRKGSAVHVTPRAEGWAVMKEGSARASSIQPTKSKAVAAGKTKASNDGVRLVEHDKAGRIAKNTKPVPKDR